MGKTAHLINIFTCNKVIHAILWCSLDWNNLSEVKCRVSLFIRVAFRQLVMEAKPFRLNRLNLPGRRLHHTKIWFVTLRRLCHIKCLGWETGTCYGVRSSPTFRDNSRIEGQTALIDIPGIPWANPFKSFPSCHGLRKTVIFFNSSGLAMRSFATRTDADWSQCFLLLST